MTYLELLEQLAAKITSESTDIIAEVKGGKLVLHSKNNDCVSATLDCDSVDIDEAEFEGGKTQFESYYDKVHSDVYFTNDAVSFPCLTFNEQVGNFVGFFDYNSVPMMTNVGDRFLSFHSNTLGSNKLWLQNEGLYGNIYGVPRDFWVTWRVQPDAYGDKIWSTLEYRTDFMEVLDAQGNDVVGEDNLIDGNTVSKYKKDLTFDTVSVWNEYQKTGDVAIGTAMDTTSMYDLYPDIKKKFRIWRMDIPRAVADSDAGNSYGMDRIRNPWVYLKLKKSSTGIGRCLMQMHDVVVKYFDE